LLTAAALMPALSWVLVAKPTTAFATLAAYFRRAGRRSLALSIAVVLVAVSFIASRSWVSDWLEAVRAAHHFLPLVARPGGFLLLASLIRWRRPEAWLIALLAVVPQTAAPYEALPLVLALTSRREAMIFAALSLAAVPFLTRPDLARDLVATLEHKSPIMLGFVYLPVVAMVLRRPNVVSANA
jgi:hypothetical protein